MKRSTFKPRVLQREAFATYQQWEGFDLQAVKDEWAVLCRVHAEPMSWEE